MNLHKTVKMQVLKCSKCRQVSEDATQNPHAWDGWLIRLKETICAKCVDEMEVLP